MAGKAEVVDRVAELTGYAKTQVAMTYDLLFEHMGETLAAGDKVTVPNFGTFQVSERPARSGRNPATGENVMFGEFLVNAAYQTAEQTDPSVAMRSDGSFLVTWTSQRQAEYYRDVFGRSFHGTGLPRSPSHLLTNDPREDQHQVGRLGLGLVLVGVEAEAGRDLLVGLDLGARTPEEIALCVISEIVLERRGGTGLRMRDKLALERAQPRPLRTAQG